MRIYTSLKPAVGRIAEIQAKARTNWEGTFPHAEVIDVQAGDSPPTFNEIARLVPPGEVALYCNGDILFESGVDTVLRALPEGNFLAIGERIDTFEDGHLERHRPSGMDYFFFRGGMFEDLPQTVVGRAYYDSALLQWALQKGLPVIDLSPVLKVAHQWHDYGHLKAGRQEVFLGTDALKNKLNNGLRDFGPHIADAPLMMTKSGVICPNNRRGLLRKMGAWRCWNLLTRGGRIWGRWWPL